MDNKNDNPKDQKPHPNTIPGTRPKRKPYCRKCGFFPLETMNFCPKCFDDDPMFEERHDNE